METYVARRVSDENERTFDKFFFDFFFQFALQELNLSIQFNLKLALPDIITNKTSGENAMSDKYCFQSYASKRSALTLALVCLNLVCLFFVFVYDLVFVYVITQERQSLT